jgi:hypothetical protein
MRRLCNLICFLSILAVSGGVGAQGDDRSVFRISEPDFILSPHSGMTRKHWKDAARYLLEGAFSHIKSADGALVFPKQTGKSYPQDGIHTPGEKLEGLCRTLFIAAPLLKEDPALTINGIRLADYYRHQLVRLLDPASDTYIEARARDGKRSKSLVEFGGLAVSLFAIPEILWDPLPKARQDALAALMLSHGDGPSTDSNWRFFNILILSFFDSRGYSVNRALLEEYLEKTLEHYRGAGWYSDNPEYDYYSMWAFQMYGLLWSEFYGGKHYPALARKFTANFRELKTTYPYVFGRNGEMIMWGRSISYRFAAVVPFTIMGLTGDTDINYGWMRRIASGALLQFLRHPDFLKDGVPSLGFYGAFEPAVQAYSARASVYWMGKAFLGLLVPAGNPFWTSKENEGAWEQELAKGEVHNKFLPGPEILVTNYPDIGAAEIRAWRNVKTEDRGKAHNEEDYNRLAYNSAFPWQADGANGTVAMNYVIKNKNGAWEALRLYDFKKFEDGVYYRDARLESDGNVRFYLADIPLPNGILRVDKYAANDESLLRLGHYALPRLGRDIKRQSRKVRGYQVEIINNGVYQLAMIPLAGWDSIETVYTSGLHPASRQSAVINVTDEFGSSPQPAVYAALMLWKQADEDWTDDELLPVTDIERSENDGSIVLVFKDGARKSLRFEQEPSPMRRIIENFSRFLQSF